MSDKEDKMDFHAAMETFAEAWVAANTQTAVNTEGQVTKPTPIEDLPTQLPRDQLVVTKTTSPTSHPPMPPQHSPSSSSSSSSTRSLPIHCIIEQTNGPASFDSSPNEKTSTHNTVELDTYAILPGTTLLSECVRAALVKLGYNSSEALGAKGAIQIKNWRPLGFETITDNKVATIEDMLGELTQVSTLRIRICSDTIEKTPTIWTDKAVRNAVISLLKDMNQSMLAKLSPLSQSAISNIANWKYNTTLSRDKCEKFGAWYKKYKTETSKETDVPFDSSKESRLTFHPEYEIPLLRKWFNVNKNPTDEKLYVYANELNKGCVRQERPMITVAKLKNWWKNERQREKRMSCQMTKQHEMDQSESEDHKSDPCRSPTLRSGKRLRGDHVKGEMSHTESGAQGQGSSEKTEDKTRSPVSSATIIHHVPGSSPGSNQQHNVPHFGVQIVGTNRLHVESRNTQNVQSVSYSNVSVQGTSQSTGFVSLLHNAAGQNDVENGNRVILSDGTVVRPVPLLHSSGNRNENQSVSPGHSLIGSVSGGVRTGNDWNRSSQRQQAAEHPGAPRVTADVQRHPWS